jgi:hypothetical protein
MLAKAIRRDQEYLTPATANVFLDEYGGGEILLDAFHHHMALDRAALRGIC